MQSSKLDRDVDNYCVSLRLLILRMCTRSSARVGDTLNPFTSDIVKINDVAYEWSKNDQKGEKNLNYILMKNESDPLLNTTLTNR